MAGGVLRVVPRTTYEFSKLSASQNQMIMLAGKINVAQFKEATLYVRFHSGTSLSATPGALDVIVAADGYTDEDPAAIYAGLPAFVTVLSTTDVKTLPAYGMKVIAVPANFGGLLAIILSFTQAGTPLATATVSLSVDLSVKE